MHRICALSPPTLLIFLTLISATAYADGSNYSVQVDKAHLRQSPAPFSKILATLKFGTPVERLQENSGWMQVQPIGGKKAGWVHSASLQKRTFTLQSGQAITGGASKDEIALASKGFNENVEKSYRSNNNLDYTSVDKMEQLIVSESQQLKFLKEGNLSTEGESHVAQ